MAVTKVETEYICEDCGEKIVHIYYGGADQVCGSYESTWVCYECAKAEL